MEVSSEHTDRPPLAPWGLRDILYAGLVAIGLMVGAGILGGIGYVLWMSLGLDSIPLEALTPLLFVGEALLLVPAWLFGPKKYARGWEILGLRPFVPRRGILAVIVGLGLSAVINLAWTPLMERLGLSGQPEVLPLFGEGIGGLLMAILTGGIVAAVAEEVLFRGFIYGGLRCRLGVTSAVVISSAIFAVIHVFPGVIPPIFVMGVILALIYEFTGSIWPCIIMHGTWNVLSFIALFLAQ